jgi:hypothetical protein
MAWLRRRARGLMLVDSLAGCHCYCGVVVVETLMVLSWSHLCCLCIVGERIRTRARVTVVLVSGCFTRRHFNGAYIAGSDKRNRQHFEPSLAVINEDCLFGGVIDS